MRESFDYVRAYSIADALGYMQDADRAPVFYAGGTDVLVKLRAQKLHTGLLIDVKYIPELNGIAERDDGIVIGAAVTHSEIASDKRIGSRYPAICDAVSQIGSVPIRNKATLGGNIQNASPAGDGVIVCFALDGTAEVCSAAGTRRIPLASFFLSPGKTALKANELITGIALPKRDWCGQRFYKVGRRNALAISVVNGTVALALDGKGTICDCRIAAGAVAPTPVRLVEAERILLGNAPSKELFAFAAQNAADTVAPISDIRASARYRAYMTGVCIRRALWSCVGGEDGNTVHS